MLGQVATLGRFKGIADVMGIHLSGFPGWFVARTYHLYALPLLSRKLRVVADWTTPSSSGGTSPSCRASGTRRASSRDRRPLARRDACHDQPSERRAARERLTQRQHGCEEVAVTGDPGAHLVDRERCRVESLAHLVPGERRRDGRSGRAGAPSRPSQSSSRGRSGSRRRARRVACASSTPSSRARDVRVRARQRRPRRTTASRRSRGGARSAPARGSRGSRSSSRSSRARRGRASA